MTDRPVGFSLSPVVGKNETAAVAKYERGNITVWIDDGTFHGRHDIWNAHQSMPRGDVIHHPRSPSTWLLVCVHCPARYVGGHWSIAMAVCQPRVKWHRIGRNHNSGDFSVMGEMYNISYPCKYRQFIITGRYTVKNDTSNVVLIDLVCRPISLLTLSCLSWLSFVSSSKTTSIVITLTSLSTDSFISIDHILPRHIALCQQLKHSTTLHISNQSLALVILTIDFVYSIGYVSFCFISSRFITHSVLLHYRPQYHPFSQSLQFVVSQL